MEEKCRDSQITGLWESSAALRAEGCKGQWAFRGRHAHFSLQERHLRWGQAYLEVRHGHTVLRVTGLLDGPEEVSEGLQVDARLRVHAQHGVRLPCTCRGMGHPQGGALDAGSGPTWTHLPLRWFTPVPLGYKPSSPPGCSDTLIFHFGNKAKSCLNNLMAILWKKT